MGLYDNPYFHDNVYGHLKALLERLGLGPGVHLDFGCGFGRSAEVLRDELGLTYVGADVDDEALTSLRDRGFETFRLNLSDLSKLRSQLQELLGDRPLRSVSVLDTLEHLAEPERLLQELNELAGPARCPLVISVPNAGHRDVGFKLAFGRWDSTPTGLLDRTHLQVFTEEALRSTTRRSGWYEIDQFDVLIEESDQHFPRLHPALAGGTLLHELLRTLRDSVDETARTNQFVRMYLPGPAGGAATRVEPEGPASFLSVVTRTQGRRLDTLRDALLCLSAQTDQDFEIVVVGHRLDQERILGLERVIEDTHAGIRSRISLVRVDHGGRTTPLNVGFAHARGDYVAILDDDDFVFANWVEGFKKLAERHPGKILRTGCVVQTFEPVQTHEGRRSVRAVSGFERRYPLEFDLFEHLIENHTPPVSLAFPRSVFADLNFRFDETLTTTEDWDFLMRAVAICGVAGDQETTAVYRQWSKSESSLTVHDSEEWRANHHQIWRKLDATHFILPEGSVSRLRTLMKGWQRPTGFENDADANALRERAHVILNSRSWKLTAPLRLLRRAWSRRPVRQPRLWQMDVQALRELVESLERDPSWTVLSPIRRAKRRLMKKS
jgi:SAM-dependent methyltransferase